MNHLIVTETTNLKPLNEILHKILTFVYFLAHQTGLWIVKLVQSILPRTTFPDNIVDPLGFLIILTLFMLLVSIAKKVAWIIVCVAWILLFIKILMIVFKLG